MRFGIYQHVLVKAYKFIPHKAVLAYMSQGRVQCSLVMLSLMGLKHILAPLLKMGIRSGDIMRA